MNATHPRRASLERASGAAVVIVVNPNNPDGRFVPHDRLAALLASVKRRGGLLIVDEAFADAESFYSTLAHETTHWTRHPSRLERDFGRKTWGDEGYAREELVAELGSAFLCADLELTPDVRDDHASYIASWLEVLKNDKRCIVQAASYAQKAVDFLHSIQPEAKAEAA